MPHQSFGAPLGPDDLNRSVLRTNYRLGHDNQDAVQLVLQGLTHWHRLPTYHTFLPDFLALAAQRVWPSPPWQPSVITALCPYVPNL